MNIRTIDIKGKQYTPVAERVRLVHETRESFEIVESTPYRRVNAGCGVLSSESMRGNTSARPWSN